MVSVKWKDILGREVNSQWFVISAMMAFNVFHDICNILENPFHFPDQYLSMMLCKLFGDHGFKSQIKPTCQKTLIPEIRG